MKNNHLPAILQALAAAVLFGMSAPLAKLLLGEMEPIPLARCSIWVVGWGF